MKKGYERKEGRKTEGVRKGRRERGRQKTKVKKRGWVGSREEGRETVNVVIHRWCM